MITTRWYAVTFTLGLTFLTFSCQSPQQTNSNKMPPASAVAQAADPAPGSTFSGAVVHVNARTHLLTVKSTAEQKEFTVGPKIKVFTETSAHGTLSTLNTGDLVDVEYEQLGASATATRIVRKAVAAGEKSAPSVERLERMLNPDPSDPYKRE
jgi:hypothetical protein